MQVLKNKNDVELVSKRDAISAEKYVQTTYPFIHLDEKKAENLHEEWTKVAHRLDVYLMVIFLVANVTVCVCLLVIGNSKLNQ